MTEATESISVLSADHCRSLLHHQDATVRLYAIHWFDIHPREDLPDEFEDLLQDKDTHVVCRALDCLGNRQAVEFGPEVLDLFENSLGSVSGHCAFTLGKIRFEPALPVLAARLAMVEDVDLFLGICYALAEIGGELAESVLWSAMKTAHDDFFREYLTIALLRTGADRFTDRAVQTYFSIDPKYLDGRETLQWFWKSADLEPYMSVNEDQPPDLHQIMQWVDKWHTWDNDQVDLLPLQESLTQYSKDPKSTESFQHIIAIAHRTIFSSPHSNTDSQAAAFVESFYRARFEIPNREPGQMVNEIRFLVACTCSTLSPLTKEQWQSLDDNDLVDYVADPLPFDRSDMFDVVNVRMEHLFPLLVEELCESAFPYAEALLGGALYKHPKLDEETVKPIFSVLRKPANALQVNLALTLLSDSKQWGTWAVQAIQEENPDLIRALSPHEVDLLGRTEHAESNEFLFEAIRRHAFSDPISVARAALNMGSKQIIPLLTKMVNETGNTIFADAARILGRVWDMSDQVEESLKAAKTDSDSKTSVTHLLGRKLRSVQIPSFDKNEDEATVLDFPNRNFEFPNT
jgi:hypothetical protein